MFDSCCLTFWLHSWWLEISFVYWWDDVFGVVAVFAERFKFLNPNVWENKTFVHYIKADETSTISCQAEGPGDVAPSISWSFMESAVPSATANNSGTFPSGVFISPNQTMTKDLVFKEAAASQNGIYQCLAKLENPGNEPEQLTLKFNVKVLDDS